MKKNMIALAVAGALVAPVAMAEVTVSGQLQAEVVQVGGSAKSENGIYVQDAMSGGSQNGGNYGALSFVASEDLGGGMKAVAKYAFNVKTDSTTPGVRDAYVGLSGGFGTVMAGRMNHPYKTSTVGWDPMLSTSFQARGNGGMGGSTGLSLDKGGAGGLYGSEVDNALAYANNFMGGMIKLVAAVIVDETGDTDSDGAGPDTNKDSTIGKHAKALSLTVSPMSGLDVVLAYADLSKLGGCKTSDPTYTADLTTGAVTVTPGATACAEGGSNLKATKLGAKFSAGAITVAGQVEQMDKGWGADKFNVMFLTGTFKLDDANSISASYGSVGSDAYGTTNVEDATYMALGMKHAFSKSTSAMIGYRQSNNIGGTKDNDEKVAGVGMRVAF